jgi:hypothetical protein
MKMSSNFQLPLPPEADSWPLHLKNVPLCHEQKLLAAMRQSKDEVLQQILREIEENNFYFSAPFLSTVTNTRGAWVLISIVHTMSRHLFLWGSGTQKICIPRALLSVVPCSGPAARTSFIWSGRSVMVVPTVFHVAFTPLDEISLHLGTTPPFTFVADSASCYNQFAPPEEVRDYYAFETPEHGILRFKTTPRPTALRCQS